MSLAEAGNSREETWLGEQLREPDLPFSVPGSCVCRVQLSRDKRDHQSHSSRDSILRLKKMGSREIVPETPLGEI